MKQRIIISLNYGTFDNQCQSQLREGWVVLPESIRVSVAISSNGSEERYVAVFVPADEFSKYYKNNI